MLRYNKLLLRSCLLIFSAVLLSNRVNAEVPSSFTMSYQPNIDVILSSGETQMPLDTFKVDLTNSLKSKGIDTDKVNIQALETHEFSSNSSDASTIFNHWTNYPNSSGAWTYDTSNNSIYSTSNVNWTGYWDSSAKTQQTKDVDISYNLTEVIRHADIAPIANYSTVCHPDPQGFTFRMTQSGGGYSYYAFWIYSYQQVAGLFKVENISNPDAVDYNATVRWTQMSHPSMGYVGNGTTWLGFKNINYNPIGIHGVRIVTKGNRIIITYDGNPLFDVTDTINPLTQGSYGPFTISMPNAKLFNINVKTQSAKTFDEAMSMPTWRADSDKYVVNVDDNSVPAISVNNQQPCSQMLSKFLSNNTYYVGWGTGANQAEANNFIAKNDYRGTYVAATPAQYAASIDRIANYIVSISGVKTVSNSILIGHDVSFNVAPSYLDGNSITSDYPNGSWKLIHDYGYFHNNLRQADYHDTYIPKPGSTVWNPYLNPKLSITKPGAYDVMYQLSKVGTIYAHRRPVAQYDFSLSGTTLYTTDNSYDLDYEYTADKGIAQRVWSYKKFSDANWTIGYPSILAPNTNYLIKLQVLDKQGSASNPDDWSYPDVKYITTTSVSSPVANFDLRRNPLTIYDTIAVVDKSYDATGRAIYAREWTIQREGTTIAVQNSINGVNLSQPGNYTIILRVQNSAGAWSSYYRQSLTVTPDVTAPEIMVESTFLTGVWTNKDIPIKYTFNDYESGMNNFKIVKTASSTPPATYDAIWGGAMTGSTYTYTLNTQGTWYVHVQATDNAGKVRVKTCGPYKIDKTAPTSTITVDSFVSNAYKTVPVVISNIWDGESGVNSTVASLNSDYSNAVTTTQASGSITLQIPREKHVLNQVVYVKMTDNVGNVRTYSFNTYIEPYLPNPPVITSPADSTDGYLILDNEPLVLKWNYSDPIDAAQKSATVTITNSVTNAKQTFVYSGASTSFTMVPSLAPGKYTVELTVTNQYDKTSGASSTKIRKNLHILSGYVCTTSFSSAPISPFQYVNILTTSEVPDGTTLDGYIVYPNSNGSYEANLTDITKVINKYSFKLTNQGLQTPIRLPYKVTKMRIYYNMAAKTSNLTPVLDNLTVLAK